MYYWDDDGWRIDRYEDTRLSDGENCGISEVMYVMEYYLVSTEEIVHYLIFDIWLTCI